MQLMHYFQLLHQVLITINGVANIYRGPTYGDLRIVEGDGADDVHDIYEADDIRYTKNGMIGMERGYLSMLGKWPSNDRTDDNVVIRVEEMHLIYAEAMLRAGDTATAKTYLNNVQAIRGASLTDATLDNIILKEEENSLVKVIDSMISQD